MAGVFSISFIRRRARSRAQRAESTWTACGLCDWGGLQVHSVGRCERRFRQAVEDSSMGTRMEMVGLQVGRRRKKEDRTTASLYGPTPYACRLASCTQGWLPSIPIPAHAPKRRGTSRRRYCRAACAVTHIFIYV
jgi:hypothetical protein